MIHDTVFYAPFLSPTIHARVSMLLKRFAYQSGKQVFSVGKYSVCHDDKQNAGENIVLLINITLPSTYAS